MPVGPVDIAMPGWFGKLPMLGDFASRRLPPPFVERCDEWLAGCVAVSREALGARWLETYLGAPLWHFAFGAALVDARCWRGVLMPSVDAVGRYFPLLLAAPAGPASASASPSASSRDAAWHAALAEVALATLAPGATLEALETALEALGLPPADTNPGLAARESRWWPDPDTDAPATLQLAGLPDPALYTRMLETD